MIHAWQLELDVVTDTMSLNPLTLLQYRLTETFDDFCQSSLPAHDAPDGVWIAWAKSVLSIVALVKFCALMRQSQGENALLRPLRIVYWGSAIAILNRRQRPGMLHLLRTSLRVTGTLDHLEVDRSWFHRFVLGVIYVETFYLSSAAHPIAIAAIHTPHASSVTCMRQWAEPGVSMEVLFHTSVSRFRVLPINGSDARAFEVGDSILWFGPAYYTLNLVACNFDTGCIYRLDVMDMRSWMDRGHCTIMAEDYDRSIQVQIDFFDLQSAAAFQNHRVLLEIEYWRERIPFVDPAMVLDLSAIDERLLQLEANLEADMGRRGDEDEDEDEGAVELGTSRLPQNGHTDPGMRLAHPHTLPRL
ncbi:hypothetical protein GY45DRAFT_1340675 [Cubamyces sp. BRFM 1775]|nr:hypothetical protein GY45DRAFT_1340675 [Cubamyces sp. BRFM 1775]